MGRLGRAYMKILIIQQKRIGDVLTSSILFEALKEKFPDALLHYVIHPYTVAVVEKNPNIDKIILFDPKTINRFLPFWKFCREIRKEKYDVVIDAYSKTNSGFITAFSQAEKRISYHKWYTSFFYSQTFQQKKKAETKAGLAIENRMLLLQGISKDFPIEIKPKIFLSEAEKSAAKLKLQAVGISDDKPLLMIGILGSSPAKTYPLEYMAKLLNIVVEQVPNAQILCNYLPSQKTEARSIYNLCSPKTRHHIFFNIEVNSLRALILNLANCNLYFGNEGGGANIAKALNIPTFAIHSPFITKNNWGIYNNEKDKVAVHLKDYKPELFQNKKDREIKLKNSEYYSLFKPELIQPKLETFLKNLEL